MTQKPEEMANQLLSLSINRLHELEVNAELSRVYHDGRTTAALRSVEKQRCMHLLIQDLCAALDITEGNDRASD